MGRARPPERCLSTGIRFRRLEDHMMERQAMAQLNRIVGDLQREELRVQRQPPAAAAG